MVGVWHRRMERKGNGEGPDTTIKALAATALNLVRGKILKDSTLYYMYCSPPPSLMAINCPHQSLFLLPPTWLQLTLSLFYVAWLGSAQSSLLNARMRTNWELVKQIAMQVYINSGFRTSVEVCWIRSVLNDNHHIQQRK
jgi:hypothetical protein